MIKSTKIQYNLCWVKIGEKKKNENIQMKYEAINNKN